MNPAERAWVPSSEAEKPRYRVSQAVLGANIRGNEALPQRHFGLAVETLAAIFNSKDPADALDAYLNAPLSDLQLKGLAAAGTKLHTRYGIVNAKGEIIAVTPMMAASLWGRERRATLSFLYQVLRMTLRSEPRTQISTESLADPALYAQTVTELMSLIAGDPAALTELGTIFKALRKVQRSKEMEHYLTTYKLMIQNRNTTEGASTAPGETSLLSGHVPHQEYGHSVRDEILRRANRLLWSKSGGYGAPSKLRLTLARNIETLSIGVGL